MRTSEGERAYNQEVSVVELQVVFGMCEINRKACLYALCMYSIVSKQACMLFNGECCVSVSIES
jgi:hypothetical protein